MNFNQLREEINALSCHPLTPTQIQKIYFDSGEIVVEHAQESTWFEAEEELKKELKDVTEDREKIENDCYRLTKENEGLENTLKEIDDGTKSVEDYRAEYEELAAHMVKMKAEWIAANEENAKLRKRKDVATNLIRVEKEVLNVLNSIDQYPEEDFSGRIKELRSKSTLDLGRNINQDSGHEKRNFKRSSRI